MRPNETVHVLHLWSAVVFCSLLEALAFPGEVRGAAGAAYVAANVLVFFAALLLLAHVVARRARANPRPEPRAPPASASAPDDLAHLFVHVMCAAFLRTACWFEARVLFS